ncbi:hypothetical protein LLG90_09045 [Aromatoleum toluclasticum]|uniref:hypothetical protein n=1 Tax=Aromatoleum toluclasticum TaxID=92003 RepID=UPI001D1825BB|nr:hypothetical protein [Aromatoleum toluclasticum]MCC4115494.1 hypothetical protein [Aromatoleum toluclasticum]
MKQALVAGIDQEEERSRLTRKALADVAGACVRQCRLGPTNFRQGEDKRGNTALNCAGFSPIKRSG